MMILSQTSSATEFVSIEKDTNDEAMEIQQAKESEDKNHISFEEKDNTSVTNITSEFDLPNDVAVNSTEVQKDILLDDSEEDQTKVLKSTKKKKIKKRIKVLDSDSEDDVNESFKDDDEKESENKDMSETENLQSFSKSKKRITMLDTDSEEEVDNIIKVSSELNKFNNPENLDSEDNDLNPVTDTRVNSKNKKKSYFQDSDSDEDSLVTPHNKSFSKEVDVQPIYTTGFKGELVPESAGISKTPAWKALCDSESSGPEDNEECENTAREPENHSKDSDSDNEVIKPIKYKRKKKSKTEDEHDQMTSEDASKLRDEIRSESQRMCRESTLSLPYHRPKSFTLKEFLAKRPKFASALPASSNNTSPSLAIKMSVQQLELVYKNLEERHKEVKEFYKSDSEPEDVEDKNDPDYNPESAANESENGDKISVTPLNNNGSDNQEKAIEILEENKSQGPTDDDNLSKNGDIENIENSDKIIELDDQPIKKINIISEIIITNPTENDSSIKNDLAVEKNEDLGTKLLNTKEIGNENKSEVEETYNSSEVDNIDKLMEEKTPEKESDENQIIHEIINESEFNDKNMEDSNNIPLSDTDNDPTPMDYDFNLDDMEDNSEKILQEFPSKLIKSPIENNLIKDKPTFEFGELDNEIENYEKKKSKLELLKERLSNFKPRLSSGPNHMIDLDTVARPQEVTKLMERFAQHTAKKVHHKDKVQLNIVSVEHGGEIHNETVALNVDDDEDIVIEEKPGVRLQRLRNDLQSQIAQRKSEIWQQRAQDINLVEENVYDGEKSECGADDPILDDEEEEEMSESSEEEEYGDEIEEEKPIKKSVFVDDEADESDIEEKGTVLNEGKEDNEELDADDENDEESDEEESNEIDGENQCSNSSKVEDNEENVIFKKPLRRILKGFTEDSDDDDEFCLPGETNKKIIEKLNRSIDEPNDTQDDYIPPYQNQNYKTPVKSFPERSNSDLKFLTPVSYITGLQNLTNSASKLNVPSPLREADWHAELQRKLHADSIITNSQAEAMRELCSEKFSESQDIPNSEESNQSNTKPSDINVNISSSIPPSTQDILNICSGSFDGQADVSQTQESLTQGLANNHSSKFTGDSQVSQTIPSNTITHVLNPVTETKNLDEADDMMISQLLNEDEMEAFKKRFVSPVLTHSQRVFEEVDEVRGGGGFIDSDEDGEQLTALSIKKRNRKKLTFSDDESSDNDNENEDEEEIELHDNIDEEGKENVDEENVPLDEIGYDSEENEVYYTGEQEKQKLKMADFFENEAELSESEWGSADEDEKDLDVLDFEQGDKDKFDEKQLKTDLERIHMRRLLDDDTREVKLLQEMLLDDGELHGTGRERQFRWKNIDAAFPDDENDNNKNSDDEDLLEDDDNEEQWRRKRHEREMFLKEKNSQDLDEEDLISSSEILKVGHKVIRGLNNSQGNVPVERPSKDSSPALKRSFSILHKRGSFLNRSDQVLERLAEYNKITTTAVIAGKAAKNSKNFLFQTVAQETNVTSSFLNLKRKSDEGTPKIIKKLRLTENFSPAHKKKPDKKIQTNLFGTS